MGCAQSSPQDDALQHPTVANERSRPSSSDNAIPVPQQSARATQRIPSRSILGNRSHSSTTNNVNSATRTATNQLCPPPSFSSAQAPPPIIPSTHGTTATSGSRRWTRGALIRERRIFFETRVTGRSEVWQAIQLAVDMGRDGGDWDGATGLVEAAGCTITIAELTAIRRRDREREGTQGHIGIWDERGEQYRCPIWVWGDPEDVLENAEGDRHGDIEGTDGEVSEVEDEEDVGDKEATGLHTTARTSEVKGKERLVLEKDDPAAVKLRARLSDRGTDVLVLIGKSWTVKNVIKKVLEEGDYPSTTKIKLGYLGRLLSDGETLEAQGWAVGHVINVFVFQ